MKSRNHRSAGAGVTEAELLSFMQSQGVDRTADYLRRGRPHAGLKDEALAEQWVRAFEAMADDPCSPELSRAESDLRAEFDLRGLSAPSEQVKEAVKKYCSAADSLWQQMKKDPNEIRRVNAALEQDLNEFKRRRGRN
jgi:hypothetical protein